MIDATPKPVKTRTDDVGHGLVAHTYQDVGSDGRKGRKRRVVIPVAHWRDLAQFRNSDGIAAGLSGLNSEWRYGDWKTREATLEAMRRGDAGDRAAALYRDARAQLQPLVDRFVRRGRTTRRQRRYGEEGPDLDLDRHLAGDSQPWVRSVRNMQARTVRIGVYYALSCGNTAEEFAESAASAAAACDVLNSAGIGVDVLGLGTLHGPEGSGSMPGAGGRRYAEGGPVVTLKRAEEPLDVRNVLAVAVTGMYRDCTFGLWEACMGNKGHHGMCLDPTPELRAILGLDLVIGRSWSGRSGEQRTRIEGFLEGVLSGRR